MRTPTGFQGYLPRGIRKLLFGYWADRMMAHLVRESQLQKVRADREEKRADKNYADCRAMHGEVFKLLRKLENTKAWNAIHRKSIAKLKEQVARDREYIGKLKAELAELRAASANRGEL